MNNSTLNIPISAIPFFVHKEMDTFFHLECNHRTIMSKEMIFNNNNDSNLITSCYDEDSNNPINYSVMNVVLSKVSFIKSF